MGFHGIWLVMFIFSFVLYKLFLSYQWCAYRVAFWLIKLDLCLFCTLTSALLGAIRQQTSNFGAFLIQNYVSLFFPPVPTVTMHNTFDVFYICMIFLYHVNRETCQG